MDKQTPDVAQLPTPTKDLVPDNVAQPQTQPIIPPVVQSKQTPVRVVDGTDRIERRVEDAGCHREMPPYVFGNNWGCPGDLPLACQVNQLKFKLDGLQAIADGYIAHANTEQLVKRTVLYTLGVVLGAGIVYTQYQFFARGIEFFSRK